MKENKFKILSAWGIQCVKCNHIMTFPLGLSMDMIKNINCDNCREHKKKGDKSE